MMRLLYIGFRIYCFIFRPKALGVRVMLIKDGQVLLVRQTYLPGWFMPGGGVKRGETLEQAIRREAYEEIGAKMGKLTLLGAYTHFGEFKSDHSVLFHCADFTFSGKQDREIAEVRFFPLDALPDGLLTGHRRRLEEYRAGVNILQFGEW
jgi:8-oxo-dGTP pyrophosphatase MutT (NUDIX family)